MAYPTVSSGYGFKPVNLIGGRVYAGSTRMVPIKEAYGTSLYNGDLVKFAAGSLNLSALTYNSASYDPGTVGVFVGAEYSTSGGPIYGKNRYQYWAGGTVAQDAVGYVVDDPQACFRTAVYAQASAGASGTPTAIGYVSQAFVGSNVAPVNVGVGSASTGDSTAGVSSSTAPTNGSGVIRLATTLPFRIVQLVPDTAVTLSGTGTSSSTTITLSSAITNLQAGMQVIVSNAAGTGYTTGGYPGDFNYVTNVNGTTVTIANAITQASTVTMTFVGYPEVIVGWNFGYHSYMNAAGV
jgi:hypothetical protein